MELYVQYNEICEFHERGEEDYADWHEEYSFEIVSVSLTTQHINYDEDKFTVNFTCVEGDPVYVLYMTYSDGDSFGSATGKGQIIWVFKNEELALSALEHWKLGTSYDNEQEHIKFTIDGNRQISLYNETCRYFTNIEDLIVQKCTVIN